MSRIVDIGPLLDDLKKKFDEECDHPTAVCSDEAVADEIDMLEALPVINLESLRPTAKIAWKKRTENYVSYKQIPESELLYNGEYVYAKNVKEVESDIPYCPECHIFIDCLRKAKYCSFCGVKLEITECE